MKPWLPRLVRFAIAAALGGWVLWVALMQSGPRGEMSTFGQFALAAATMLLLLWEQLVKVLRPTAPVDLDKLTDDLALAVRTQWEQAAAERGLLQPAPLPIRWRRSKEPVAGPSSAALAADGPALFDPLPGLERVTKVDLLSGGGSALHRLYGGLPSGRLVLVGAAGSGKTSAAVLLLLDALRYRDQVGAEARRAVPVPVLVTLAGWNADLVAFERWLAVKFAEIPLLSGRDGPALGLRLLRTGRISLLVDGADELPPDSRAAALRALSSQVGFRVVLLTRTAEMVEAAARRPLTGAVAVELAPLSLDDASDYLLAPLVEPAPTSWRALVDTLASDARAPVSQALASPLLVGLIRDSYAPDDPVEELSDRERFPDVPAIAAHLLDRAVEVAYEPRAGHTRSRYSSTTARRTLTFVAQRLDENDEHGFGWWSVRGWVSDYWLVAANFLLLAVALPIATSAVNASAGFYLLVLSGTALGVLRREHSPLRVRVGSRRGPAVDANRLSKHRVVVALAVALGSGLLVGMAYAAVEGDFLVSLVTGMILSVPIFVSLVLVPLLVGRFVGVVQVDAEAGSPRESRRSDLLSAAFFGTAVAITFTVVFCSLMLWVAGTRTWPGIVQGSIVAGLFGGAAFSGAVQGFVAQLCLAVRYRTPLFLVRFTEDARSRHLLRTVGPVYEFRHALLQDRLAGVPTPDSTPDDEQSINFAQNP